MFTKWMQGRKIQGPVHAMVASKRFSYDLTPLQVAHAIIRDGWQFEKDGVNLSEVAQGRKMDELHMKVVQKFSPEDARAFTAEVVTKKQVKETLQNVLMDYGLGEYLGYLVRESEGVREEYIEAVAMGLVDAFVDEDTINRLFGEDAA